MLRHGDVYCQIFSVSVSNVSPCGDAVFLLCSHKRLKKSKSCELLDEDVPEIKVVCYCYFVFTIGKPYHLSVHFLTFSRLSVTVVPSSSGRGY